ncbi:MAG: sensor domain-containing protein [Pseudomonadota bacterium]
MTQNLPGVLFTFLLGGNGLIAMPHASERLLDITGLAPGELAKDATPLLNGMHPEDVAPFVESAQASAAAMEPWRVEFRVRHPDKGEIWIEWLAAPARERDGVRWQGFMHDISERKRLEAELRTQSGTQATLLHALSDVGLQQMVIENGRIIHVGNRALAHEFGFTDAMIDAHPPLEAIIHPDDRARILSYHRRRLAGKPAPATYEVSLVTLAGVRREFEVSVATVPDSDPPRIVSVGREITERKAAQQRTELLERAIDASSDAVFFTDSLGRFHYVNATACRSLGYTREELLGMTPLDIDPGISPEALQGMIQKTLSNQYQVIETHHRTKSGRIFPVEISASMVEFQGEYFSLVSARDITERKRMELALSHSEREFRSLAENTPDNIARWDTEGRYLYINPVHERTLGAALHDIQGQPIPDSHVAVKAAIAKVIATGETVQATKQSVHVDGKLEWHDVRIAPEFDPDGKIIGVLGIGRDMTDFYRMQESLAAGEQAFRNLAESAPDTIIRYDLDQRILYLNDKLTRKLGLSGAEGIIGRKPSDIWPDGRFAVIEEASRRAIAQGEIQSVELRWEPEPGRPEIGQILVAPERDLHGRITGSLAFGRDITAIRESEHRLKHFIDNLPGFAFTFRLTPEGHAYLPYASAGIRDLFGLAPLDVQDDFTPLLMRVPAEDRPSVEKAIAESAASLKPFRREFRVHHPARVERWVDLRAAPERLADGSVLWYGLMLDITDRKRMEDALWENHTLVQAILESSPEIIVFALDRNYRYLTFNRHHRETMQAIWGCDIEIGMSMLDAIGDDLDREKARQGFDRALSGEAFVTEEAYGDAAHARLHWQTFWSPIRDHGGIVTGLTCFVLNITARQQAEENVRALNTRLTATLSAIPDLMFELDRDGVYLDIWASHPELLVVPKEHLIGRKLDEVLPLEAAHLAMEALSEADRDGDTHGKVIPLRLDTETRWFEHSLAKKPGINGADATFIALSRDITERKRTEDALREREREFRTLTENLPVAVIRYDLEQRRCYLNPAAERMLHGSADELLGHVPGGPTVPATPGMLAHYRAEMAKTLASGRMRELEFVLDALPVEEREYYEVRFVPECDELGSPRSVLAIWYEITERKRMQESLAASEQGFRSLAANLPDVIVRYDRDCRRSYVSPLYARYTGRSPESLIGKTPAEDWALPDGPSGGAAFQAHLRQVLISGQPGVYELAWIDANGQRMFMELRSIPEFAPDGQVGSVLTIARDFSAQREMEDGLRMAASVFQAAREGIIITDPKGHILDINPAFTRITGYSREEALGQRPAMLSSGQQYRAFYQSMWSSLRTEGAWAGELINRRKNGEHYFEHLDIVAVHDANGQLKHYIGIFSDVTALREHERHLQHIAHHDTLTGLPNRLLLIDRLTQAIAIARRASRMLAVLFIDLDGFKPINDNHGHASGDRVLVEIARRMAHTVRTGDTVARLGGDEFVVLLSGLSDTRECESTTRRLLDAIAKPVALEGHTLNLSASIGISLFPNDGDDPDILLRYADQAMYSAKAAGRNQFVFHDDDAREKNRIDGQLIHDLREALEHDQISVHYQPIVDMATGRVVKAEALARWTHPERGEVSPSVFIPVAESAGLIHAIGDRVFAHATRVAREWNTRAGRTADDPLRISINRSPRQFFNRDGVCGWVHHLIEKEISGEHLTIEITEGLLLDDRPDVLRQLDQLRAMGMKVALDDFGTGYSALSYLKKFEIDILKIDRSFVRDIVEDPSDRAIVESIILMAKRLGIKLVAEGVETHEQAELLAAAGCDMAQGYFFARPMPEAAFMDFVLATGDGQALRLTP